MHRGAELQETHTFIPAHAQYTARAPKSGPSPNPAGIPYFSPPNQDGLRPFLPLQAAQPSLPNQPPVGFQPGSSLHMELKGKEQIQEVGHRLYLQIEGLRGEGGHVAGEDGAPERSFALLVFVGTEPAWLVLLPWGGAE